MRANIEAQKRKGNKQKGLHDWRKQMGEDHGMAESKTPFNSTNRNPYPPFKKSTSLYEARNKMKTERAKIEKGKKGDNTNNTKESSDKDIPKVPRLIPAKSSPGESLKRDDDGMYSIPSYRKKDEMKGKGDLSEYPVNWEVSRIEQNSDLEKSFKKEMTGFLPFEEQKSSGAEIEKRLEGFDNDDEYLNKSSNKPKKVSASPASEDKINISMLTSNKDTSKHDLSRMMITVDQYIYVISGYKNTTLSSVERLNMNKGIWQPVSDVNIARTKFGSVSVRGQKIYLLGGKLVDGSRTDIIEEYDVYKDTWIKSKFKMPAPRSGFSTVLLNDKQLIVIGGNDGQVLDSVHLLNISTGEWSQLPSMMTKRDELAVNVGPDGKIYAIGGYGGQNSTCLKSVERFNLQTYEWEKIADLNEPRRALAAVSLPDGVYAIGGYNGSKYLGSMERYDEIKD